MANKPKTNSNINGKEYYRTRITVGHDEKGKAIRKNFYGTSKNYAESKKKKYMTDIEAGLNPDLSSQSLDMALHAWLWNIERFSGNKTSSYERYEGIYRNYIKDTDFGMNTISQIKKISVQKYYNELKGDGKSYSQIKNLQKLLNKFFGYAEADGYILRNPCKGIKIPKDNESDLLEGCDKIVETFTHDEISRIFDSLGHEKIRYIITFALLTGLRQGEILALEKTDIKNKSIVKVNKTIRSLKIYDENENYYYEKRITKPKSKYSNREVPLPDVLKSELIKLEKLVSEEKLKLGPAYKENSLLFPSMTGTYIDAKNLINSWNRALKQSGIKYKKFHALRHTYATSLFENNTSILTISRLLGHSSIKTTEIYTHVLGNIKSAEVEGLNNMFTRYSQ